MLCAGKSRDCEFIYDSTAKTVTDGHGYETGTKSVTEGPPPVPSPRLVTVRVEYRQPNGCVNVSNPCNTRVVFFGSWMQPGGEVLLSEYCARNAER